MSDSGEFDELVEQLHADLTQDETGLVIVEPLSERAATAIQTLTTRLAESEAALKEVILYRRGEGKYNFSHLPSADRDFQMFDAWEEVEAQVIAALNPERNHG